MCSHALAGNLKRYEYGRMKSAVSMVRGIACLVIGAEGDTDRSRVSQACGLDDDGIEAVLTDVGASGEDQSGGGRWASGCHA